MCARIVLVGSTYARIQVFRNIRARDYHYGAFTPTIVTSVKPEIQTRIAEAINLHYVFSNFLFLFSLNFTSLEKVFGRFTPTKSYK